jgi:hypothetical protein
MTSCFTISVGLRSKKYFSVWLATVQFSSLQNKIYKLYLISLRRASFVCHLIVHFFGNQVKLSSTYGNTAAGFSYYSCDRAVHNIVTLFSLASCPYITSLLPNIINFLQFDAQNFDHQLLPVANYCQSFGDL